MPKAPLRFAIQFKGVLLAFILVFALAPGAAADPERWRRAGFTTDFSKSTVDLGTILRRAAEGWYSFDRQSKVSTGKQHRLDAGPRAGDFS